MSQAGNNDQKYPYCYIVFCPKGFRQNYSGGFPTWNRAKSWYKEHGIWLENHCGRKLILEYTKTLR